MKTTISMNEKLNKYEFTPVFAYVRVSTEGQSREDKYGLEMQKRAIMDYCMENRYAVVKWYIDVESGTKVNRPAIMELLNDTNEKGAKKVIAFKSDRISRETKMYFYLLYEMEKKGLRLECITEEFDTESEFANLYRSMMLFVAEQERKNILYRTSKGKEVKRTTGGYTGGRIPYGYKVNGKKELELDEREAWIVLYTYYRYEQGAGYNKIANELDRRDYKTRKGTSFSSSSIRSILNNRRFYQGYVVVDGKEIRGKHRRLLKDINVLDYPKCMKEGETLIIEEIYTAFNRDPSIKARQNILAIREKNRANYLQYKKIHHPMDMQQLGEYRRSLRKEKPVEEEQEQIDKLTFEEEIRRYMESEADTLKGE